jgi:hypothetical protein
MEVKENFFEENEAKDLQKLIEFNEKAHIFNEIKETEIKHYTDATGYSMDRLFNIELKSRNQVLLENGKISGCTQNGKPYIDDDIFIEDHKVADMMIDYVSYGLEPLYINFLANGWVLIFNLSKLSVRPRKHLNLKINSKGYRSMEFGNRQGLYLKDAAIFDSNYNLVKRAGEEWMTQKNS